VDGAATDDNGRQSRATCFGMATLACEAWKHMRPDKLAGRTTLSTPSAEDFTRVTRRRNRVKSSDGCYSNAALFQAATADADKLLRAL